MERLKPKFRPGDVFYYASRDLTGIVINISYQSYDRGNGLVEYYRYKYINLRNGKKSYMANESLVRRELKKIYRGNHKISRFYE